MQHLERTLFPIGGPNGEGSFMAALAAFCSYAGTHIGGKTQPRAMAVFQHFAKTRIGTECP